MSKGKKTTLIITIALLIVATLLSCYLAMSNVNITAKANEEITYTNWEIGCREVPLTFINIYDVATPNIYYARKIGSIYTATWYYQIVDNNNNVYAEGTYMFSQQANPVFFLTDNYGVNSDFGTETTYESDFTWEYVNTENLAITKSFNYFTDNTTNSPNYVKFKFSLPSNITTQDIKLRVCHTDEMANYYKEIATNEELPFYETYFYNLDTTTAYKKNCAYVAEIIEVGTTSEPKYPIKYNQEVIRTEGYDQGYREGYTEGQQSLTETEQYQNGYNQGMANGYKEGSETGYDKGYKDCETENKEAWFQEGYDKGSYDVNISVTELTGNTIGSIGDFIMNILTIEVAGISLWSILAVLGGLIIIGIIIKLAT